ncbi:MAG: succinate dehydrogenase assembly factor 2 [Enterobacterales bacterium]|nr:succinate dehydrogenase assembly factor 2 [Enterobacterales bacterium]
MNSRLAVGGELAIIVYILTVTQANLMMKQNPTQNSKATDSLLLRKLEWQCRRGMLELDVILGPFLARDFSSLDADQQTAFVQLLEHPDPDLYTWIMGYGDCPHEQLYPILKSIQLKMSL